MNFEFLIFYTKKIGTFYKIFINSFTKALQEREKELNCKNSTFK